MKATWYVYICFAWRKSSSGRAQRNTRLCPRDCGSLARTLDRFQLRRAPYTSAYTVRIKLTRFCTAAAVYLVNGNLRWKTSPDCFQQTKNGKPPSTIGFGHNGYRVRQHKRDTHVSDIFSRHQVVHQEISAAAAVPRATHDEGPVLRTLFS